MAKNKNETQDQLKTIEENLTKAEIFIEDNKNLLMTLITVIALLFSGFFAFNKFYIQPKEKNANIEMYMSEKNFEQNKFQEALDGDEQYAGLLEIINLYSGTKAANLAEYYAGISYFKLGNLEEAITHLDNFSSEDEILAAISKGVIGDAFAELGQNTEALSYYLKAANIRNNEFTTPIYLMKAANAAYLLEENEQALNLYRRIEKDFANTREAQNIEKYISRMTAIE